MTDCLVGTRSMRKFLDDLVQSARYAGIGFLFGFWISPAHAHETKKDKARNEAQAIHDAMFARDPGTTPFRLTARFQTKDYLGIPQGEGSIEELWFEPHTWKVVIRYAGTTVSLFDTNGQHSIAGAGFLPVVSQRALQALRTPAPDMVEIEGASGFEEQDLNVGQAVLRCVSVQHKLVLFGPLKEPLTSLPSTTYCADDRHVVHLEQQRSIDRTQFHDSFLSIKDRYQPRTISVRIGEQERVAMEVMSISLLPSLGAKDVAPPADALPLCINPPEVGVPGKLIEVRRKNEVRVQRSQVVHGVGSVEMMVDRDGFVKDMDVESASSSELAASLLSLAKQQVFEPMTCNGIASPAQSRFTYNVR